LENSENVKIFKTFINTTKSLDITMKNLDSNSEYIANCELSDTDYDKTNRKNISITIGNYESADIVKQLIPSKDENRVPQCAKFNFENNLYYIDKIIFLSTYYCYYMMKKDELPYFKGLPTVKCQATKSDSKSITFCVAPLPLYNLGAFFTHQDKEVFDNNFEQFLEDEKKYFSNANIKVKNIERIKDVEISKTSINTYFESNTNTNPMTITFNVLSTHNQPVQCFYNSNLNENCKFSLLRNSIILTPNQKSQIKTMISSPKDNKMYSLNFICYNSLPGFEYRYKTTGIMTMYTYLYSNNSELEQSDEENITETTINCNIKKNLLNPRCLKDKYVSMIEKKYKVFHEIKKEGNMSYLLSSKLGQKNTKKPYYNQEKPKNKNNDIKSKKNKLLVPYPFKRLQKRIRKFFSVSKIIDQNKTKEHKLSESVFISNNANTSLNHKCSVKVLKLKAYKLFEDKKGESNIYRYKMNLIKNFNKGKIVKKDKSVSTDNILLENNYYENKRKNSLFKNKLIASLTKSSNHNISNYNNKNKRNENSRSIIVYHKNY
jgi:hypothetical protein